MIGQLGRAVSVVGLGCWQLGADWGTVDDADALAVLHAAVDSGVTFLDTADVYGDGRSEALIGRFLRDRGRAGLTVATKMGRRVDQVPENYSRENFLSWNDRSRANLGVEPSISYSCTARPRPSTPATRSTTHSTRWSSGSGSRPMA